jgi:hypothetical protein
MFFSVVNCFDKTFVLNSNTNCFDKTFAFFSIANIYF